MRAAEDRISRPDEWRAAVRAAVDAAPPISANAIMLLRATGFPGSRPLRSPAEQAEVEAKARRVQLALDAEVRREAEWQSEDPQ